MKITWKSSSLDKSFDKYLSNQRVEALLEYLIVDRWQVHHLWKILMLVLLEENEK